jgi:hypothetical protein
MNNAKDAMPNSTNVSDVLAGERNNIINDSDGFIAMLL